MTLPQPYNDQQLAQQQRVKGLEAGGYIECVQQRWLLTDLGWRALSAAAKARVAPHRQTKAQIEAELHEWARDMIRVGGWWQSK